MKKVFILAVLGLTAFSADAQRKRTRTATSQGNVVLRGGIGFNSMKSDPDGEKSDKSMMFSLTPSVGYMVVDNLELGVNVNVSTESGEDVQDLAPTLVKQETAATDFGFGVYAMKYFPLNNWFAFTTIANIGLNTGSYTTDDILGSTVTRNKGLSGTRNGVGGALNFGMAFTPYNAFSIQANIAGLGVSNSKLDPDNANDLINQTDFGFNVWRQAYSLDFVWYFGRGLWKK
jgi:hypothetical protein